MVDTNAWRLDRRVQKQIQPTQYMVHYWKTSLVLAHWVLQPTRILDRYEARSDKDKERRLVFNEVEYKTDVKPDVINTDNGTLDRNLAPASDGVLVHGLYRGCYFE